MNVSLTLTARPTETALWTPDSWRQRNALQQIRYDDSAALKRALTKLRSLPPLVTSWEIENLKSQIADAQVGKRFLLQGGDCAETLADCTSNAITSKLKILLQMSLVLIHGAMKPVIRVGRFAGQYAKPRSSPMETQTRDGESVELPSYFGDLVNLADFTPEARRFKPEQLVEAYHHAAMTLNFIRSLSGGGFADVHHPEYWDLSFIERVPGDLRHAYEETISQVSHALRFMEVLGETDLEELTRVEFFTSHEGLNLLYESAQTRTVPRRSGHYLLTTHLPWIGERTRQPDGAHIEFFRGVRNPVGIKLGPSCSPDDLITLLDLLNPDEEPGRIVLIVRMGAAKVREGLPPLVERVQREGRRVLWVTDPMHGNTQTTSSGVKTRHFEDILAEIKASMEVHQEHGGHLGGVHFEMTGEDVTECIGGADNLTEDELHHNYQSPCDPRLNYKQGLEMAFLIARHMKK